VWTTLATELGEKILLVVGRIDVKVIDDSSVSCLANMSTFFLLCVSWRIEKVNKLTIPSAHSHDSTEEV
jgi:hypothetical protein